MSSYSDDPPRTYQLDAVHVAILRQGLAALDTAEQGYITDLRRRIAHLERSAEATLRTPDPAADTHAADLLHRASVLRRETEEGDARKRDIRDTLRSLTSVEAKREVSTVLNLDTEAMRADRLKFLRG